MAVDDSGYDDDLEAQCPQAYNENSDSEGSDFEEEAPVTPRTTALVCVDRDRETECQEQTTSHG